MTPFRPKNNEHKTDIPKKDFSNHILSQTRQAIFILDKGDIVVSMNTVAKNLLTDYQLTHLEVGTWFWSIFNNRPERTVSRLRIAIKLKRTAEENFKFVSEKGEIGWLKFMFNRLQSLNGENQTVVVVTEITDKQLSKALATHLDNRYKKIVQSQQDLICWFHLDGEIIFVNNAYCEFFGVDKHDVLGSNFFQNIPEEQKHRAQKDIAQLTPSNPHLKNVEMLPDKDGKIHWITGTNTAFFNSDGNITEIQIIAKDITELINLQDDLVSSLEKAEESDRLKTIFLANLSHEVRTPLNGILGFTSLLKSTDPKSSRFPEYCAMIDQAGKNLLEIISDLLELSMLQSKQMELHTSVVYLPSIIENLEAYTRNNILMSNEMDIEVISKIPQGGVYFLNIDAIKLSQIFMKLLNNALKFTHSGKIEFGYEVRDKDMLRFYVQDTGIGIAPELHEKIFDTFRQGDESKTRKYGGNGVGLSIASGLARTLGSELKFESEPGKGAYFYFEYTINEDEHQVRNEEPVEKKRSALHLEGKNILIVEDNYTNMLVLRGFLKESKANIIPANTGHEALLAFNTSSDAIDLVLMDIRLPDMPGYEVAKRIKKINPQVPIIAQTAYNLELNEMKVIQTGCDDLINKPITREILMKRIRRHLQIK